ncbi:uncharacterized protein LOC117288130 [Asterias rubens]|uniref:uncharacterized protein LOC117288130 n=1 Tax=Asterias rubens TaxID=7604 RepID=UPI001454F119|nr:uncharacterized protein LOC117288130 [Asterias rubens]
MLNSSQRLAVAITCLSVMCLAEPRRNYNRVFGPTYGKRTQNDLRPVNYLNLMDEEAGDSVEVEKEPMPSSLALYIANLSPGKRHMLSQLLAMTRMNSEAENE